MDIEWIVRLVVYIVGVVIVSVLGRCGLLKRKDANNLKEDIFNMLNRRLTEAQSFPNTKKEYVLDEKLNILVESGTTDLQELINSSRGTALEELLKRMLPEEVVRASSYTEQYDRCVDELEELSASIDAMERARTHYNMPLTATYTDIFNRVVDEEKILAAKKAKEVKESEAQRSSQQARQQEVVQGNSAQSTQAESSQGGE